MNIEEYMDNYFEKVYTSNWIDEDNGKYIDTHFMRIYVYSNNIIKICPKDNNDLNDIKRLFQIKDNGVELINDNIDHLLDDFNEVFKELHKVCVSNEYRSNFPNGGWEH